MRDMADRQCTGNSCYARASTNQQGYTSLSFTYHQASNSPNRIEPVSLTCVLQGETGKSTCKLCLFFHTRSLSSNPLFSLTLLQELALRGKQLDAGCPWKSRWRKWSRYVCFSLISCFFTNLCNFIIIYPVRN